MKKKYLIILVIILIFNVISLCSVGFYINHKTKRKPVQVDEDFEGFPISNLVISSDKLSEEHCIGNFCITELLIDYYPESTSKINGKMTNKNPSPLSICFRLHFNMYDDRTVDVDECVESLEPNSSTDLDIEFNSDLKDLIDAVEYELLEN